MFTIQIQRCFAPGRPVGWSKYACWSICRPEWKTWKTRRGAEKQLKKLLQIFAWVSTQAHIVED